ncbi:hypothetical protein J2T57_002987 [Natronocella acetinitrilica]|jgi:hypothetical protein|uniref:Uncharacterized protein n=1 Tax=Natronocella acetinitrilica TaxID=414046 RepID=A0AAE3KH05_9GAMM|nr:hypothetical protein [Natronocella acetinitrilica]MCP1675832.1 hypothetical protein [Natronocella acetinitrilica]
MTDHSGIKAETMRMRRTDEKQCRVLMAVGFFLFLPACAVMRLVPGRRRGGRTNSIIAEAKTAASIAIPFAFRG